MTLDLDRQFLKGFAAGCEAGALPRRERHFLFLRGSAPYLKLLRLVHPAEHQTRGHSPKPIHRALRQGQALPHIRRQSRNRRCSKRKGCLAKG